MGDGDGVEEGEGGGWWSSSSSSSSSVNDEIKHDASSSSAHSERSASPWHKAGLMDGCGFVATRTSCFSDTVALNKKGISP